MVIAGDTTSVKAVLAIHSRRERNNLWTWLKSMVISHTLEEMEGGRNGELSGTSRCRQQKKKKSSSPNNAMSCNWLVTGHVSPKGVRAIICVLNSSLKEQCCISPHSSNYYWLLSQQYTNTQRIPAVRKSPSWREWRKVCKSADTQWYSKSRVVLTIPLKTFVLTG